MNSGMFAIGTKRTSACALHMSAFDPKRTLAVSVLPFRLALFEPYDALSEPRGQR